MKVLAAFVCCSSMFVGAFVAMGANGGYDYPDYQTQVKQGGVSGDAADEGYSPYNSSGDSDSVSSWAWPTMSSFEMFGPMRYKKGAGHATMSSWNTSFDFVQMSKGRWGFNADGAFRMSWIDGSRDATLDVNKLFTIWTNMNVSYRLFGSTRLVVAVTPQWSSDFDSWVSDNFFLGGHAALAGKWNDNTTYVAGAAYVPQFGDSPWIPYFGIVYKMNERWTLDLMAPRLALKNKVSEGFTWGPFFSIVSGTWTVKRNRHHERFEWRSCALGIFSEVGLGQWGRVHPKLLADVGMSCWNRARFKSSNGDTEYDSYRFDPGFYLRVGFQLSF